MPFPVGPRKDSPELHTVQPVPNTYDTAAFSKHTNEKMSFPTEAAPLTPGRITQPPKDRATWKVFASRLPTNMPATAKIHTAEFLPDTYDTKMLTLLHNSRIPFPLNADPLKPSDIQPKYPAHVPDRVNQGLIKAYAFVQQSPFSAG